MILDAFWTVKNGELVLYVRRKRHGYIVEDIVYPSISPYFFVDKIIDGWGMKFEKGCAVTIDGKLVDKIIVKFPSEVKRLREKYIRKGICTYESNIPFVMRWMIDENIQYSDFGNPLYFDIEVDWRDGLPHPIEGRNRVLAISYIDKAGNGDVICERDESTILRKFIEIANNYDCLVGYNVLDFDVPILKKRMELLGLRFRFGQVFDLYKILSKIQNETITNRLDDVAEQYLGVGKTEIFRSGKEMFRAFLFEQERFKRYAFRDAELCLKLDEKLGLLRQFVELMKITKLRMEDLIYPKKIVEAFILNTFYKESPRVVLPYVGKRKKEERYKGAFVFEPIRGLHEKVAVLDFTSLYNRVMQTFNICLSTIGGDIRTEKLTFTSEKYGILPRILVMLEELRNKYKRKRDEFLEEDLLEKAHIYDLKQYAMKRILLSVYGYIGYENSPFYRQDVAESVTLTGRRLITFIADYWRKKGYTIIGGDTDSFFLKLKTKDWLAELKDIETESNVVLKEFVLSNYNVPERFYKLELHSEKVFDRLYFAKKKNYIGRLLWKDGVRSNELVIKGLPLKKLNTPLFLRKFMKRVYLALLDGKTYREIVPFINETRRRLYSGEFDRELVFTMVLKKDPDTVKSNQPYYRVARKLKEKGLFRVGDSIRFVWATDRRVEPVVYGVVPKIEFSGYSKYWELVKRFLNDVFGKNVGMRDLEGLLCL